MSTPGHFLVITIDTEADCAGSWVGRSPASFANIPLLQSRLLPWTERSGAVATLLLNADVIADEGSGAVCASLWKQEGWELGTHLHGELVAPFRTLASSAGAQFREFQCGYKPDVEFRKMAQLRELFARRFEFAPRSFRAGRYGAGPNTFAVCRTLGYAVDSSVVPRQWFQEGMAVADFTDFDYRPRWLGGELMEIPISVKPAWCDGWMRRCARNRVRDRVAREAERWGPPLWLRPSYSSAEQLRRVVRWLGVQEGPVVANVMFHSNELLASGSPYNQTEEDVAAFLDRLGVLLEEARECGFVACTLSEAASRVRGLAAGA